jgi:hypothetical protein
MVSLNNKAIRGTASASVAPSAAVTSFTSVTVQFPNGASGMPVGIRASGSVSGILSLQYAAGNTIQIPINPNAPYTSAAIPNGAYKSPVTQVTLEYQASGAGTLFFFVDFA